MEERIVESRRSEVLWSCLVLESRATIVTRSPFFCMHVLQCKMGEEKSSRGEDGVKLRLPSIHKRSTFMKPMLTRVHESSAHTYGCQTKLFVPRYVLSQKKKTVHFRSRLPAV